MRNFFKLAENIHVGPLLHDVQTNYALWSTQTLRQTFERSPHADVEDIWLRFNAAASLETCGDDLECVDYPAFAALPSARPLVFNLMRHVEADRLGRVMITKLAPGKTIARHRDVLGEYALYYTRYHVVLQGLPGALFHCGDETVTMQTGEAYWFNAHKDHEVVNNSSDDRVHLIIDLRRGPPREALLS